MGEMTDEEWGNLDDRLTRMEVQEEGIFAEINKHSEMTNVKGKIVEVTGVENKTVNRPNDDDSVGVVKKERSLEDVMNLLITMKEMMDKHFDNMNKRLDERDKMLDEWSRELKTDQYQESTEVELNQVSDNDKELINNSDKIVGEVGLTSENNDGDYNSEVSGDVDIINSSDVIMLNNNNEVLDSGEIEVVSEREKGIDCKGVVINVDELDNEWKESYIVGMKQGANFYGVKCEAENSQVLMEDKSSSIIFVEDESSSEGKISFLCLSGRARWYLNNFVVLPSAWNGRVQYGYELSLIHI